VCQEEAGQCLGLELVVLLSERAKKCLLFFEDLLDAKIRELNPCYTRDLVDLLDQFSHVHADISGNRQFVEHLRNRGSPPTTRRSANVT
jgi:type I restriction enzyme R subunit